ncbi:MAG: FadR/GntR family transcriptional regulator [Carboxydocellales bacterium]
MRVKKDRTIELDEAKEMFSELRNERAFVEVVNKIKKRIFESKLLPGDRLPTERELCEVFGVSRMALREALRVLELSGLIEIKRGSKGGIFVADLVDKLVTQSYLTMFQMHKFSLDDFFKARLIIEPEITAEAARIRDKQFINSLKENLVLAGSVSNDAIRRLEVGREFHILIARSTENMFLEQILKSVVELANSLKIWDTNSTSPLWEVIPNEHLKILEAIEQGDAEQAKNEMRSHLQSSYDFFRNNK